MGGRPSEVRSGLLGVEGNGWRVKFWKDKWCSDLPLGTLFSKDAWVAEI